MKGSEFKFVFITHKGGFNMKFDQIKKNLLHTGVAVALVAGMATTLPSAYAGGKITIDDKNGLVSEWGFVEITVLHRISHRMAEITVVVSQLTTLVYI